MKMSGLPVDRELNLISNPNKVLYISDKRDLPMFWQRKEYFSANDCNLLTDVELRIPPRKISKRFLIRNVKVVAKDERLTRDH